MEYIASWKSESKFHHSHGNAMINSLVERFLGSHYANLKTIDLWFPNASNTSRIVDIYHRLELLGFLVVILKLSDSLISQAVGYTRVYRNPFALSILKH